MCIDRYRKVYGIVSHSMPTRNRGGGSLRRLWTAGKVGFLPSIGSMDLGTYAALCQSQQGWTGV
jgi:hypothetical protein